MSENAKEMIDFLVKEGIIKVRIDDIWGANDLIYVYDMTDVVVAEEHERFAS